MKMFQRTQKQLNFGDIKIQSSAIVNVTAFDKQM